MNPLLFLALLGGVTFVAAAGQWLYNAQRRARLGKLAGQWAMQYLPQDRLRLAERVSEHLPPAGAADVLARDLMYRTDGDRRSYLFTVEFSQGVIRRQRRRQCVAGFDEPAARQSGPAADALSASFRLAPQNLPLIQQYRWLHEQITSAGAPGR
jgi:hypothetical protein